MSGPGRNVPIGWLGEWRTENGDLEWQLTNLFPPKCRAFCKHISEVVSSLKGFGFLGVFYSLAGWLKDFFRMENGYFSNIFPRGAAAFFFLENGLKWAK